MKASDISDALGNVPEDIIGECLGKIQFQKAAPSASQNTKAAPKKNNMQHSQPSIKRIAHKPAKTPIRISSFASGIAVAACLLFAIGFGYLFINTANDLRAQTGIESMIQEAAPDSAAAAPVPYTGNTDSFASMYFNTTGTYHIYKSLNGQTDILDFETMETKRFCGKPDCQHNALDCGGWFFNGMIPLFDGRYAYYFSDTASGTNLMRYDYEQNQAEKLTTVDGISAAAHNFNNYGMYLHDGVIYFIGYIGHRMMLYSVDLATLEPQGITALYDFETLSGYYPEVRQSGEVYMQGEFDGKLWFNVGFVTENQQPSQYYFYVTYFDLETQTYHGEPEDYAHIDFSTVSYASKDYLVITREGQAEVYKAGQEEPVIFNDECFNHTGFFSVTVFDDILFAGGKAFDLNTAEIRRLSQLSEDDVIIAKYGDSYIAGAQHDFRKIPAAELFSDAE